MTWVRNDGVEGTVAKFVRFGLPKPRIGKSCDKVFP
jgi:hypothetical protein